MTAAIVAAISWVFWPVMVVVVAAKSMYIYVDYKVDKQIQAWASGRK